MSRIPPFARGMAILALIAAVVLVLNLQTSLATVSLLLGFAFFIAIAVVAYLVWRDFGRQEIGLWHERARWVFYTAVALLVVDLGWFYTASPGGRDLLAFLLVAAGCIYVGVRTWREQHRYS